MCEFADVLLRLEVMMCLFIFPVPGCQAASVIFITNAELFFCGVRPFFLLLASPHTAESCIFITKGQPTTSPTCQHDNSTDDDNNAPTTSSA